MTEDQLRIVPVPPLVMVLAFHESEKGAPLTEAEVLAIADKAICMRLPESEAAALTAGRGYDDISTEHPWEEWSARRLTLGL